MTRTFAWIVALWTALVPALVRADHPVVIELFTSQGCSSCPPADRLMHELAVREDVIALSLHVDTWDYIGWKDSFADPAFTKRQRGYARAKGDRSTYTPQMIIGGVDHVIGTRPMEMMKLAARHGNLPSPAGIQLTRSGNVVEIRGQSSGRFERPAVVQLVRYIPRETVQIRRGENAGRTFTYANIVTSLEPVGRWTGAGPLQMRVPAPGPEPVVVLVQLEGYGRIIAAARLR